MTFLSPRICPSDLVQVFAFEDDYSFGILQSSYHFEWFRTSSKLKVEADSRYSVRAVFETFPWPQSPTSAHICAVAAAAREIRMLRELALETLGEGGLRELYRILELPGKHALKDAHARLDEAVHQAYGAPPSPSIAQYLVELNAELGAAERQGVPIQGPGIPEHYRDPESLMSDDCYTEG
jgi:hypothetical protein